MAKSMNPMDVFCFLILTKEIHGHVFTQNSAYHPTSSLAPSVQVERLIVEITHTLIHMYVSIYIFKYIYILYIYI